jgi:hypothetical protein
MSYYKIYKYSYKYINNIYMIFIFNHGLRTSDVLRYHPYNKFYNKDKYRNEES